jgi:hypothetical protein
LYRGELVRMQEQRCTELRNRVVYEHASRPSESPRLSDPNALYNV